MRHLVRQLKQFVVNSCPTSYSFCSIMTETGALKRVMSIQSHTVHGYVGNKCAVLPLQLNGYDVDAINTVQFSNHTGYPVFKGPVMSGQELLNIVEGLQANALTQYSHLLTGYIGSLSLLQSIKQVLTTLRAANPNLTYVCDPVCGDEGRLYVSPELVAAFRSEIVPLSSVLTPNQFEAEQLTGLPIATIDDALRVCRALHDAGPSTVVISSMQDPEATSNIAVVASQRCASGHNAVKISVPRIDAYFTGTGDLFSAMLLIGLHTHPQDLGQAVERAVAVLQHVLQDTAAASRHTIGEPRTAEVCDARELRLVRNRQVLSGDVVVQHKAVKLHVTL